MSQLKKSQDTFGIKLLCKTAVKVATINHREKNYSANTEKYTSTPPLTFTDLRISMICNFSLTLTVSHFIHYVSGIRK